MINYRYNQGGASGQPSPSLQQGSGQDPYNRYMGPTQPPGYPARTGYGGPPGPPSGPPNQQQSVPSAGYPGQQDYYRQDQVSIHILYGWNASYRYASMLHGCHIAAASFLCYFTVMNS